MSLNYPVLVDGDLTVYGGIVFKDGPIIPTGLIIMWYGDPTDLNADWCICDGSNNSPDLRDKFVQCCNTITYNIGDTGGAESVTLSVDNLAFHNHSSDVVQNTGSHIHEMHMGYLPGATHSNLISYTNSNDNFLNSSAPLETAGDHNHTFTTDSTGLSTPFDIIPRYYSLYYIMKL